MNARPRVFIGLAEIAGYFSHLKRGFDDLGVPCVLVDALRHRFRYVGAETRHGLVRILQQVTAERRRATSGGRLSLAFWVAMQMLVQTVLMLWALPRYDLFIFGAGHSFLEGYDLPLLRLFGKKVISVFTGTDCRPPCLGLTSHVTGPAMVRQGRWIRGRVRRFDRHSVAVVNAPYQTYFQSRPVLMFQVMGLPQPLEPEPAPRSPRPKVRVLHCPSRIDGKGTRFIRAAVDRLIERGIPIDYVEVIGKPNSVVCMELEACDFVVDELYSDTPMAGFAAEAARFGRATIVGGYDQEGIRRILPEGYVPPVYSCQPEAVEEAIERLVTDRALREDLGRRAREFVRSVWSSREVAARYLRASTLDVPKEWWYDPRELRYVAGCGLRIERVRERIQAVLESSGRAGLLMDDKPELEQLLVDFAEGRHSGVGA